MSDVPQFQAVLFAIVEFRIEPMQQIAQVRGHLTGQIAQVRGELVQTRADIMERIDGLQNQVTIIGRRFLGDLFSLETASRRKSKRRLSGRRTSCARMSSNCA